MSAGLLIGIAIGVGYVVVGVLSFRAVRVWEFRDFERRFPTLYADDAYRAEAWGEWGWAAFAGVLWPICLPFAVALTHRGRAPKTRSTPPPKIPAAASSEGEA